MKILALDTSMQACSVALLANDQVYHEHDILPQKQGQHILPMIHKLVGQAGIKLAELDGLAFTSGPGSFTGVRIGTGVIQALAYSHDIPVIVQSSLSVIAQQAFRIHQAKRVLVAMDARMEQVYWGYYQLNDRGLMVANGEEKVSDMSEVVYHNADVDMLVGNGWQHYANDIAPSLKTIAQQVDIQVDALYLLDYAQYHLTQNDVQTFKTVIPSYIRNDVVRNK